MLCLFQEDPALSECSSRVENDGSDDLATSLSVLEQQQQVLLQLEEVTRIWREEKEDLTAAFHHEKKMWKAEKLELEREVQHLRVALTDATVKAESLTKDIQRLRVERVTQPTAGNTPSADANAPLFESYPRPARNHVVVFMMQELEKLWQRSWRLRMATTVVVVALVLLVSRLCLSTRLLRSWLAWLWASRTFEGAVLGAMRPSGVPGTVGGGVVVAWLLVTAGAGCWKLVLNRKLPPRLERCTLVVIAAVLGASWRCVALLSRCFAWLLAAKVRCETVCVCVSVCLCVCVWCGVVCGVVCGLWCVVCGACVRGVCTNVVCTVVLFTDA